MYIYVCEKNNLILYFKEICRVITKSYYKILLSSVHWTAKSYLSFAFSYNIITSRSGINTFRDQVINRRYESSRWRYQLEKKACKIRLLDVSIFFPREKKAQRCFAGGLMISKSLDFRTKVVLSLSLSLSPPLSPLFLSRCINCLYISIHPPGRWPFSYTSCSWVTHPILSPVGDLPPADSHYHPFASPSRRRGRSA